MDLRGWWDLPAARSTEAGEGKDEEQVRTRRARIAVLVQCKASSSTSTKRLGPAAVRELEGVLGSHAAPKQPSALALAVLLSSSGFSDAARVHAESSRTPLGLIHLPFVWHGAGVREDGVEGGEGELPRATMRFNKAAREVLGDSVPDEERRLLPGDV